jgi:hypothetical protein
MRHFVDDAHVLSGCEAKSMYFEKPRAHPVTPGQTIGRIRVTVVTTQPFSQQQHGAPGSALFITSFCEPRLSYRNRPSNTVSFSAIG